VKLALRAPLVYAHEIAVISARRSAERGSARQSAERLEARRELARIQPVHFPGALPRPDAHPPRPLAEARAGLERSLALAEEFGEQEILSLAHGFFGYFARCYGDPEVARRHLPEALRISERMGSALSRSFAYRGLGGLHLMEGRWAEAVEMFDKALEDRRTNRTVLWAEPYTMSDLAECYVALGRNDEAVDMAKRALVQATRLRSPGCESNAMLALARVELAVEGAGAIEEVEGCSPRRWI